MAQPGGPMFDPQGTAVARKKTQRRRALGAVSLVVAVAAIALVVQGRRGQHGPKSPEPADPSIAAQLRAWHESAGPMPTQQDVPPPFVDLHDRAERDVKRAVEATGRAKRSLDQAENAGVDPRKLDALRDQLGGSTPTPPPALSTERAL